MTSRRSHKPPTSQQSTLGTLLIDWADQHGRHDLPWQYTGNPYHVWLSEIMLQQTQVNTVIGYFDRFIRSLPTIESLAGADIEQVLALWSGLGYYRRAHHLHQASQAIVDRHQGLLPESLEELMALPGIGRSTAGAILALGHGTNGVICDGNVKRVLSRLHALDAYKDSTAFNKQAWQLAESLTPTDRAGHYAQAIMDLGATVCKRNTPLCHHCPWQDHCQARRANIETQYPRRKPKTATAKIRYHIEAIFVREPTSGHIALIQRASDSIWPNLWCLPHRIDTNPQEITHAKSGAHRILHELTHRQLIIDITEPSAKEALAAIDQVTWVHPNELEQFAMPAPFRRFLQERISLSFSEE